MKLWRVLLSFWIFLSCSHVSLSYKFLPSLATIWKRELQQLLVRDTMSSAWGKTFRLQRVSVRENRRLSQGNVRFGGSGGSCDGHPECGGSWRRRLQGAQWCWALGGPGALWVLEGWGTLLDHWSEVLDVIKNVVDCTQNEGMGKFRLKQRLRRNLHEEGMKGGRRQTLTEN